MAMELLVFPADPQHTSIRVDFELLQLQDAVERLGKLLMSGNSMILMEQLKMFAKKKY